MKKTPSRVALVCAACATLVAACPEDDVPADASSADVMPDAGADASGDVPSDATVADLGPADVGADVPTLPPPDLSLVVAAGQARAGLVTKASDLLYGPKADGKVGDIKMYNAQAAFIIEGDRVTSGYRTSGGSVVDMALLDGAGAPVPDLFGEFFLTWNTDLFVPETIEVLADGQGGGEAHVRITGTNDTLDIAEALLGDILSSDKPDLAIVYDYRLAPDATRLQLVVTATNRAAKPLDLDLPVAMANNGDGAFNFVRGAGLDAGEASGADLPYLALTGREFGYGVVADPPGMQLLFNYSGVDLILQTGAYLAPGAELTRTYWYTLSDNGTSGLDAAWRDVLARDDATGTVSGTVSLPATAAAAEAWVVATAGGDTVALVPVHSDGSFALEVPPADLVLTAYAPGHAPATAAVVVTAGAEAPATITVEAAAVVSATVTDADGGAPLTARVSLIRQGATPSPWPPGSARLWGAWSDNISGVIYALGAAGQTRVPAGTYRAVASRGLTWEIDEQEITVTAGEERALTFSLQQAVDTTGWTGADFHVHAFYSPDSQVPYAVRALQAATDGLDLPLITEHTTVGNLGAIRDDVGVADQVLNVPAQEVTTFAYGHFGAFPLVYDPDGLNFGAVFPHDKDVEQLFAAIDAQQPGETLTQVNHPRGMAIPGAYFEYAELDPVTGVPARPERWSTNFDTVEVFNGGCGRSGDNNSTLEDWFTLTNIGERKVLSSGSDTHGENKVAGVPRNWVHVTPAAIAADSQALVAPVRARDLFVSCGPFVRFEAADGTGLGGMTGVDASGEAAFHVVVEAPTWIPVDVVRLLENGLVIDEIDVSAPADPVIRLDTTFTATPAADAWYAIEVVGAGSLQPVARSGIPYALTNPIEVDADGDGAWTPPGPQVAP